MGARRRPSVNHLVSVFGPYNLKSKGIDMASNISSSVKVGLMASDQICVLTLLPICLKMIGLQIFRALPNQV